MTIYSASIWEGSVVGAIVYIDVSPFGAQSSLGKSGMWITIKGNKYNTKCFISVSINELFNIISLSFLIFKIMNRIYFTLLLGELGKIMHL